MLRCRSLNFSAPHFIAVLGHIAFSEINFFGSHNRRLYEIKDLSKEYIRAKNYALKPF